MDYLHSNDKLINLINCDESNYNNNNENYKSKEVNRTRSKLNVIYIIIIILDWKKPRSNKKIIYNLQIKLYNISLTVTY